MNTLLRALPPTAAASGRRGRYESRLRRHYRAAHCHYGHRWGSSSLRTAQAAQAARGQRWFGHSTQKSSYSPEYLATVRKAYATLGCPIGGDIDKYFKQKLVENHPDHYPGDKRKETTLEKCKNAKNELDKIDKTTRNDINAILLSSHKPAAPVRRPAPLSQAAQDQKSAAMADFERRAEQKKELWEKQRAEKRDRARQEAEMKEREATAPKKTEPEPAVSRSREAPATSRRETEQSGPSARDKNTSTSPKTVVRPKAETERAVPRKAAEPKTSTGQSAPKSQKSAIPLLPMKPSRPPRKATLDPARMRALIISNVPAGTLAPEIAQAFFPFEPGAVWRISRCGVKGSAMRMVFFNDKAARKGLKIIETHGIQVRGSRLREAKLDLEDDPAPKSNYKHRVLAFHAVPGTPAGHVCTSNETMKGFLCSHGMQDFAFGYLLPDLMTGEPLTMGFSEVPHARRAEEILGRYMPSVHVERLPDPLGPSEDTTAQEEAESDPKEMAEKDKELARLAMQLKESRERSIFSRLFE